MEVINLNFSLRIAFIVCFLAFSLPASAQSWTLFSSPTGKYAVNMPGAGATEQVERKVEKGVTYDLAMATLPVRELGVIALAGCTAYAEPYAMSIESELNANMDNFVKGIQGTILTSRRAQFRSAAGDMVPSLEFTGETADYNMKGLVVVIDRRACGAFFLYKKGLDRGMMMERFISSFEITK